MFFKIQYYGQYCGSLTVICVKKCSFFMLNNKEILIIGKFDQNEELETITRWRHGTCLMIKLVCLRKCSNIVSWTLEAWTLTRRWPEVWRSIPAKKHQQPNRMMSDDFWLCIFMFFQHVTTKLFVYVLLDYMHNTHTPITNTI